MPFESIAKSRNDLRTLQYAANRYAVDNGVSLDEAKVAVESAYQSGLKNKSFIPGNLSLKGINDLIGGASTTPAAEQSTQTAQGPAGQAQQPTAADSLSADTNSVLSEIGVLRQHALQASAAGQMTPDDIAYDQHQGRTVGPNIGYPQTSAEFGHNDIAIGSGLTDQVTDAAMAIGWHFIDSLTFSLPQLVGYGVKKAFHTKNFWTESDWARAAKNTHTAAGKAASVTGDVAGIILPAIATVGAAVPAEAAVRGAAAGATEAIGRTAKAAELVARASKTAQTAETAAKAAAAGEKELRLLKMATELKKTEATRGAVEMIGKNLSEAGSALKRGNVFRALAKTTTATGRAGLLGVGKTLGGAATYVEKAGAGRIFGLPNELGGKAMSKIFGKSGAAKAARAINGIADESAVKFAKVGMDAAKSGRAEQVAMKAVKAAAPEVESSILQRTAIAPWRLAGGEAAKIGEQTTEAITGRIVTALGKEGYTAKQATAIAEAASERLTDFFANDASVKGAHEAVYTFLRGHHLPLAGVGAGVTKAVLSGAEGAVGMAWFNGLSRFKDTIGATASFGRAYDAMLDKDEFKHDVKSGFVFGSAFGLRFMPKVGERSEGVLGGLNKIFRFGQKKGWMSSEQAGMATESVDALYRRVANGAGLNPEKFTSYEQFIKSLDKKTIKSMKGLAKAVLPDFEKMSDDELRVLARMHWTTQFASGVESGLINMDNYAGALDNSTIFSGVRENIVSMLESDFKAALDGYRGRQWSELFSDLSKNVLTGAAVFMGSGGGQMLKDFPQRVDPYNMIASLAFSMHAGSHPGYLGSFGFGSTGYKYNLEREHAGIPEGDMPGAAVVAIERNKAVQTLHMLGVPNADYVMSDPLAVNYVAMPSARSSASNMREMRAQQEILKRMASYNEVGLPVTELEMQDFADHIGDVYDRYKNSDAEIVAHDEELGQGKTFDGVPIKDPKTAVTHKELSRAGALIAALYRAGVEIPKPLRWVVDGKIGEDTASFRDDVANDFISLVDIGQMQSLKSFVLASKDYMEEKGMPTYSNGRHDFDDTAIARMFMMNRVRSAAILRTAGIEFGKQLAPIIGGDPDRFNKILLRRLIRADGDNENVSAVADVVDDIRGIQDILKSTISPDLTFDSVEHALYVGKQDDFLNGTVRPDIIRKYNLDTDILSHGTKAERLAQYNLFKTGLAKEIASMKELVGKYRGSLEEAGYPKEANLNVNSRIIANDLVHMFTSRQAEVAMFGGLFSDGQDRTMDMPSLIKNLSNDKESPLIIHGNAHYGEGKSYIRFVDVTALAKDIGKSKGDADPKSVMKAQFVRDLLHFVAFDHGLSVLTRGEADKMSDKTGAKTVIDSKEDIDWLFGKRELLDSSGAKFNGILSKFVFDSGLVSKNPALNKMLDDYADRVNISKLSRIARGVHVLLKKYKLMRTVDMKNRISPLLMLANSEYKGTAPSSEGRPNDLEAPVEGAEHMTIPDLFEAVYNVRGASDQALTLIRAFGDQTWNVFKAGVDELVKSGNYEWDTHNGLEDGRPESYNVLDPGMNGEPIVKQFVTELMSLMDPLNEDAVTISKELIKEYASRQKDKFVVKKQNLDKFVYLVQRIEKYHRRGDYEKLMTILSDANMIEFKTKKQIKGKGDKSFSKNITIKLRVDKTPADFDRAMHKFMKYEDVYGPDMVGITEAEAEQSANDAVDRIMKMRASQRDHGSATMTKLLLSLGLDKDKKAEFVDRARKIAMTRGVSMRARVATLSNYVARFVTDEYTKPTESDEGPTHAGKAQDSYYKLSYYDKISVLAHLRGQILVRKAKRGLVEENGPGFSRPISGEETVKRGMGEHALEIADDGSLGADTGTFVASDGSTPQLSARDPESWTMISGDPTGSHVTGSLQIYDEWENDTLASRIARKYGHGVILFSNMGSNGGAVDNMIQEIRSMDQMQDTGTGMGSTHIPVYSSGPDDMPIHSNLDLGVFEPVSGIGNTPYFLLPKADTAKDFLHGLDILTDSYNDHSAVEDVGALLSFIKRPGTKFEAREDEEEGLYGLVDRLARGDIEEEEFIRTIRTRPKWYENFDRLFKAEMFLESVGERGLETLGISDGKGSLAEEVLKRGVQLYGNSGVNIDDEFANWAMSHAISYNRSGQDGDPSFGYYTDSERRGVYLKDGKPTIRLVITDANAEGPDGLDVPLGDGDISMTPYAMDTIALSLGYDPRKLTPGLIKAIIAGQSNAAGFLFKPDITTAMNFSELSDQLNLAGFASNKTMKLNYAGTTPAEFRITGNGQSFTTASISDVLRYRQKGGYNIEHMNPDESTIEIPLSDLSVQGLSYPTADPATISHAPSQYYSADTLEKFAERVIPKTEIKRVFNDLFGNVSPMSASIARKLLLKIYEDSSDVHPEDMSDMSAEIRYLAAADLASPRDLSMSKTIMQKLVSRIVDPLAFSGTSRAGSKAAAAPDWNRAAANGEAFLPATDSQLYNDPHSAVFSVFHGTQSNEDVFDGNRRRFGAREMWSGAESGLSASGTQTGREDARIGHYKATETGEDGWYYNLLREARNERERAAASSSQDGLPQNRGVSNNDSALLRLFSDTRRFDDDDFARIGTDVGDMVAYAARGDYRNINSAAGRVLRFMQERNTPHADIDGFRRIADGLVGIARERSGAMNVPTSSDVKLKPNEWSFEDQHKLMNLVAGRERYVDGRWTYRGADYHNVWYDKNGKLDPDFADNEVAVKYGHLMMFHRSPAQSPNDVMPVMVRGFVDKMAGRPLILNHRDVVMGEGDYDKDMFNYWGDASHAEIGELLSLRNAIGGSIEPGASSTNVQKGPAAFYNPLTPSAHVSDSVAYKRARNQLMAAKERGKVINARNIVLKLLRQNIRTSWTGEDGTMYELVPKFNGLDYNDPQFVQGLISVNRLIQEYLDAKHTVLPESMFNRDHVSNLLNDMFVLKSTRSKGAEYTLHGDGKISNNPDAMDITQALSMEYRNLLNVTSDQFTGAGKRTRPFDVMLSAAEHWMRDFSGNDDNRNYKASVADFLLHSSGSKSRQKYMAKLLTSNFRIEVQNRDGGRTMPEHVASLIYDLGKEMTQGLFSDGTAYTQSARKLTLGATSDTADIEKFLHSLNEGYDTNDLRAEIRRIISSGAARNDQGMQMRLAQVKGQLKILQGRKKIVDLNTENKPRTLAEKFWAVENLVSGLGIEGALRNTEDMASSPYEINERLSLYSALRNDINRSVARLLKREKKKFAGDLTTANNWNLQYEQTKNAIRSIMRTYGGELNKERVALELLMPSYNGHFFAGGQMMPRFEKVNQTYIRALQDLDKEFSDNGVSLFNTIAKKIAESSYLVRAGMSGDPKGIIEVGNASFSSYSPRHGYVKKPWLKMQYRALNKASGYSEWIDDPDAPLVSPNQYAMDPRFTDAYATKAMLENGLTVKNGKIVLYGKDITHYTLPNRYFLWGDYSHGAPESDGILKVIMDREAEINSHTESYTQSALRKSEFNLQQRKMLAKHQRSEARRRAKEGDKFIPKKFDLKDKRNIRKANEVIGARLDNLYSGIMNLMSSVYDKTYISRNSVSAQNARFPSRIITEAILDKTRAERGENLKDGC